MGLLVFVATPSFLFNIFKQNTTGNFVQCFRVILGVEDVHSGIGKIEFRLYDTTDGNTIKEATQPMVAATTAVCISYARIKSGIHSVSTGDIGESRKIEINISAH